MLMADKLPDGVVLGLDIGTVRVGVAASRFDIRLPRPVTTIAFDAASFNDDVAKLVREHDARVVVAGWPRGMQGQSTPQTVFVEELIEALRPILGVAVYLQDEALTSQRAEAELQQRRKPYDKAAVDALAATYILEDFIQSEAYAQALDGLMETSDV